MRPDAGELREELARELADWRAARFVSGTQARRFRRRVRHLARLAGLTCDEVYRDLLADAEAIEAETAGA